MRRTVTVRNGPLRRLGRRVAAGDRWLVGRIPARQSVVLDRVLPALGRSANYGRLWLAVAGGLGLTGSRRARRAGLRGLVALSAASAATNLVSKRLAGRARPATDGIPVVRRLLRNPITTSFPSGHSASAAAFATAVALESPLLAVPIALAAAAVATSRVVTGAHYPSDVAAGVALGAGAGALTLWWWPRVPPGPAVAYEPREPTMAAPTGDGVVVVVNAGAGSTDKGLVGTLAKELPDAEIVAVGPDDDLPDVLRAAAGRAKVLGVAGGDGTINLAAQHAADRDIPLLVLPGGTFNHFALDIGVESAQDAIAALRAGSAVRVDLGRVGDHVFLNTFSTGLYTDLARFRHRWERRVGKWPAMIIGMVHVLRRSQPYEVLVDGRPRRLWLLFAGNGRYRPTGFAPTYRPSLADGRLDLRTVDAAPWARTRIVLATLTRTLRWTRLYQASS
ncbi:MAG TPA: phosphatase PAP2 family protein, partial [Pseudonocardiaceae bacterium]|nr:phosphatase PAP2 family protein [Pseudonocardiaceae bacterium]